MGGWLDSHGAVESLEALEGLERVGELHLTRLDVTSLEPLRNLTEVSYEPLTNSWGFAVVYIGDCPRLTDLTGLENLVVWDEFHVIGVASLQIEARWGSGLQRVDMRPRNIGEDQRIRDDDVPMNVQVQARTKALTEGDRRALGLLETERTSPLLPALDLLDKLKSPSLSRHSLKSTGRRASDATRARGDRQRGSSG